MTGSVPNAARATDGAPPAAVPTPGVALPIPYSETRTRIYANGHATNGFHKDGGKPNEITHRYRDPGRAGGGDFGSSFFAKKLC